ncbi:Imm1 family immunity protein [Actinosynnema sp. NPDC059335]|uniref:Imm1 family immunity protein n=1 Tax=Actinosynnema sp. NPDC059335 TaxID=3346804 RepID=UPI00366CF321
MTAPGQSVLAGRDQVNVLELGDATAVVAALRAVGAASGEPSEGGLVWHFQVGGDESSPTLVAGVRGEVGALVWYEGDGEFVPVNGTNDDWASYWTWSGHEAAVPPGAEVSLDEVCAAVDQLILTRRRPACVEWRSG